MFSTQINMKTTMPRQVAKAPRAAVRARAEKNPLEQAGDAIKGAVDAIKEGNLANQAVPEEDLNVRKMGGPPVDSVPAHGALGTDTKRAEDRKKYEAEQAKKDAAR